jgi:hypothetical protein
LRQARLGRVYGGLVSVTFRLQLLKLGLRHDPGFEQLFRAAKLAGRIHQRSTGRRQVRQRFGIFQFQQNIAPGHIVSFLEVNGSYRRGDLRADINRLIGTGIAERFRGKGERLNPSFTDDDARRLRLCAQVENCKAHQGQANGNDFCFYHEFVAD